MNLTENIPEEHVQPHVLHGFIFLMFEEVWAKDKKYLNIVNILITL